MQELINKLTEKVGLNPDQAKGAVETMMGFVKSKLPEGLADKADDLFSGAEGEKVNFGGIMDTISGFFGAAKDKAGDLAEDAGDVASNLKDKAGDVWEKAEDKLEDFGEAAADVAKDAFEKVKGFFGGKKED